MKINVILTPEDEEYLEKNGVNFPKGQAPHFNIKERPVPQGKMRLHSSGRVIRYEKIEQCLKW